MSPLRVGVIGTGYGARVVAPVFDATEGCEVVDVLSARDEGAVAALCARRDVDLVSIHSPPFLHAAHVRLALRAGHHVLCDKPFALDAIEAEALEHEAAPTGVLHFVNFEFRCDSARERLRDLVAGGAIGDVEHVQWTHVSAGSRVPLRAYGWLFDAARGGGWIGAWGSHAVDFVRWALGEVVAVEATRRVAVGERPDGEGRLRAVTAEDGFTCSLALESGATVVLDSTFAAAVSLAPRIVVAGSAGALECVADSRITVRRTDGSRYDWKRPTGGDPHLLPMRRWAAVVRDAVRADTQVAPSFADGVACDRVLDRMRAGSLR